MVSEDVIQIMTSKHLQSYLALISLLNILILPILFYLILIYVNQVELTDLSTNVSGQGKLYWILSGDRYDVEGYFTVAFLTKPILLPAHFDQILCFQELQSHINTGTVCIGSGGSLIPLVGVAKNACMDLNKIQFS